MTRMFAVGAVGGVVGALFCWLMLAAWQGRAVPDSGRLTALEAQLTALNARLEQGVSLTTSERTRLEEQVQRVEELAGQVSLSADQMERLAAGVSRDKVYLEELVKQAEDQAQRSAAEGQRAERAFEKSLAK